MLSAFLSRHIRTMARSFDHYASYLHDASAVTPVDKPEISQSTLSAPFGDRMAARKAPSTLCCNLNPQGQRSPGSGQSEKARLEMRWIRSPPAGPGGY